MNSSQRYVKGEEVLRGWTPRGVSILKDYLAARRRRMRYAEVEAIRPFINIEGLGTAERVVEVNGHEETADSAVDGEATREDREKAILEKFVKIWPKGGPDALDKILTTKNYEPPQDGVASPEPTQQTTPPKLVADSVHVPKSPKLHKAGFIFRPDEANNRWVKQYLELRQPYLHIHNATDGDQIIAINLTDCTIDLEPSLGELLQRENVFAIYAPHNSYRFATKNRREKEEWIMAFGL